MIWLRSLYQSGVAIAIVLLAFAATAQVPPPADQLLNGDWQTGIDRHYDYTVNVPGIAGDPTQMEPGERWYKKEIILPGGTWKQAVLELKGARFMPRVYVDGKLVSKQNGGMAPTYHILMGAGVRPGNKVLIEVALTSLKDVPSTDASYIPPADQWRSNISSCLWDDVLIHFSGAARITAALPDIDFDHQLIKFKFSNTGGQRIKINISDQHHTLLTKDQTVRIGRNSVAVAYGKHLKSWSPDQPNLYQAKFTLMDRKGDILDRVTIPLGIKKITVSDKQFYLNNRPCKVSGGTVVWHRWVRTEEGKTLGYDTAWFHQNVISRLKAHGANYLRFHLGVPPERLLDLCDRYGLLVQYEWNFFHGMPASEASLLEQYKAWLDAGLRHPCH